MDYATADALNGTIRAIAMRHRALAAAVLTPLGVHPGQEILLLELANRGPRTQAQLAAASGCEAPTITGSVRRLEDAGLVVRSPSPTDGRVTIVSLSARGQQLVPDLRTAWVELAEQTVAELPPAAVERLPLVLGELLGSLDRAGGT